jgi:hypothetical protein
VVLYDEFDPKLMEALLAQRSELSPIAAFRGALRQVYEKQPVEATHVEQRRHALVRTVPELRARTVDGLVSGLELLTHALAERTGRPRDDIGVRTLAAAIVGIGVAATLRAGDSPADSVEEFDAQLAQLEAGLDLSGPPPAS